MIFNDPFNGGQIEVSKVDILPTNTRRVSPAFPSSPNMGDGQRMRRFKAKGQSQQKVFLYGSKPGTKGAEKIKKDFGARSRRDISKAASAVPNMGGGAEVGRRGSPVSELGRHNRVGHRIPL